MHVINSQCKYPKKDRVVKQYWSTLYFILFRDQDEILPSYWNSFSQPVPGYVNRFMLRKEASFTYHCTWHLEYRQKYIQLVQLHMVCTCRLFISSKSVKRTTNKYTTHLNKTIPPNIVKRETCFSCSICVLVQLYFC